jgi:hypothetical protein
MTPQFGDAFMKRMSLIAIGLLLGAATFAPLAFAATTGTATVTLAASANAMIQILDPAVTLTPTAADYANNLVDAIGPAGLRVQVKTNSSTGMALMVRCADAAPQIALADLLVRTSTAAGTGGTTLAGFTAITAANQNLWTTNVAQHPWQIVTTDLRILNLINYNDAISAGTTDYTNTLTYTVVAQ